MIDEDEVEKGGPTTKSDIIVQTLFQVIRGWKVIPNQMLLLTETISNSATDFRISWARLQAFLPLGFPVQGTHGTWGKRRVVEALGYHRGLLTHTGIKHITVISLVLSGTLSVKRCKKYESNTPVLFQRSNSVEISVRNIDDSWAVCLGGSVDEILWAGQWVKNNIYKHLCILYNI